MLPTVSNDRHWSNGGAWEARVPEPVVVYPSETSTDLSLDRLLPHMSTRQRGICGVARFAFNRHHCSGAISSCLLPALAPDRIKSLSGPSLDRPAPGLLPGTGPRWLEIVLVELGKHALRRSPPVTATLLFPLSTVFCVAWRVRHATPLLPSLSRIPSVAV